MKAPTRYRYDPRWELVAFFWTATAGLLIVVLAGCLPRAIGIAPGLLFFGFGVLLTVRRYAFPRSLVVDEEGVWIPSGFLRMNVRRVVFAETSAVWEAFLPRNTVLCLRCHGKTFEVHSIFLPDHESYLTVGAYIYSRVERFMHRSYVSTARSTTTDFPFSLLVLATRCLAPWPVAVIRQAALLCHEADRQGPTDSVESAGRKRCSTYPLSDARPNRSRLTRWRVCCNRLTDFPLVTKGIEEKENAVPVVFIDRFGQNLEFLATDEVVDACQVVGLQNQRDA